MTPLTLAINAAQLRNDARAKLPKSTRDEVVVLARPIDEVAPLVRVRVQSGRRVRVRLRDDQRVHADMRTPPRHPGHD